MQSDGKRVPQLSVVSMNANAREAEYAVRGSVALKAMEINEKLRSGNCSDFPFKSIISCNIGNPQALGQSPITFIRQVISACAYPPLLDIPDLFPNDVIARAKAYLASTDRHGGIGAYTDSHGLRIVREEVARFIERRDGGFQCNENDIALTTGASEGVRRVIQALLAHPNDGIMISAPQYPLYACSITMCGGKSVYYYLNEENGWTIDEHELERSYAEATRNGIRVRGIVVINPGNPVGSVLSQCTIKSIIAFAARRNLVIFADEVYQENVYVGEFFSFKKCLRELQRDVPNNIYDSQQLVSFHTVSKGMIGECGQRGGYIEYVGFDNDMMFQFRKMAASTLSSNTIGQIVVGLMTNPPKVGDESFPKYSREMHAIYSSLKNRAQKIFQKLNQLENVSCQPITGAMYAFPKIEFPPAAIEAAKSMKVPVDEMYCLSMVEQAGIVTVPGSGFGQVPGTYHFRITILPPEDEIDELIERIGIFHENFLNKYNICNI